MSRANTVPLSPAGGLPVRISRAPATAPAPAAARARPIHTHPSAARAISVPPNICMIARTPNVEISTNAASSVPAMLPSVLSA